MRGRKLEAVGIEERGRADGGVYVSDRLAVPVQRDRASLQQVGRRTLHVYGDEGMKRIRRVAQSVQLDARGNVLAAAPVLENRHIELSGTGRGRHDELLRFGPVAAQADHHALLHVAGLHGHRERPVRVQFRGAVGNRAVALRMDGGVRSVRSLHGNVTRAVAGGIAASVAREYARATREVVAEEGIVDRRGGESRNGVGTARDVRLDLRHGERAVPHAHFVVVRLRILVAPEVAPQGEGLAHEQRSRPAGDGTDVAAIAGARRDVMHVALDRRAVSVAVRLDDDGKVIRSARHQRLSAHEDVVAVLAGTYQMKDRAVVVPCPNLGIWIVKGAHQALRPGVVLFAERHDRAVVVDGAYRRPHLDRKGLVAGGKDRGGLVRVQFDPRRSLVAAREADGRVVVDERDGAGVVRAGEVGSAHAVGIVAVEAPAVDQRRPGGKCAVRQRHKRQRA